MVNRQTVYRLKSYGVKEFLCSPYLWIPALLTIYLSTQQPNLFNTFERSTFVGLATQVSQALIAITLSGLAILVSFSDRDFLIYLNNNGNFDALLFIFEYAVAFTIISTISGILIQTSDISTVKFYIFFFIFTHTIAIIFSLIDTILAFADKKADFDAVSDLDEDDIPDELKNDMQRIVSEASSQQESGTTEESDDHIAQDGDRNG